MHFSSAFLPLVALVLSAVVQAAPIPAVPQAPTGTAAVASPVSPRALSPDDASEYLFARGSRSKNKNKKTAAGSDGPSAAVPPGGDGSPPDATSAATPAGVTSSAAATAGDAGPGAASASDPGASAGATAESAVSAADSVAAPPPPGGAGAAPGSKSKQAPYYINSRHFAEGSAEGILYAAARRRARAARARMAAIGDKSSPEFKQAQATLRAQTKIKIEIASEYGRKHNIQMITKNPPSSSTQSKQGKIPSSRRRS